MKYISRFTALLLALIMLTGNASALTLNDLTEDQMAALYQAVSETSTVTAVTDVLGATVSLLVENGEELAASGTTFQWYEISGEEKTEIAGATAYSWDAVYGLEEKQYQCLFEDADGNAYQSNVFSVAAQTDVLDDYLNTLYTDYDELYYVPDAPIDAYLAAAWNWMQTWNVTLADGTNLARNVLDYWLTDPYPEDMLCSCAGEDADFCILPPEAAHAESCGWHSDVTVVTDEDTGISVRGDLPEGVSLSVTAATGPVPEIDTRHFNALRNYPIITGYNITLQNPDGTEYVVPEGTTVRVRIPGAWLPDMEYPAVDIYHVKDSGEVVYLTSMRNEVVLADDYSAWFETDGFSSFWITSGSQYTDYFQNGEEHVFYMVPGTEAQVGSYVWLFNQNAPNARVWAESTNAEIITVSVENGTIYVAANQDAKPDPENPVATVTIYWAGWDWTNSARVTVYIISEEDKEEVNYDDKFTNQLYPVQIAVRNDGVLPSEPSIYDSSPYTYFKSDLTVGSPSDHYRETAENVINKNILYHEKFYYISTDGKPVIGMYDATGEACLQFLTDSIDWDKILEQILDRENVYCTYRDGEGVLHSEPVKRENKEQYKVIPYVIKCQETDGRGWHIDCAVVRKDRVTLFYDFNLPSGMTINTAETGNIGLPNNETGVAPAKFTVGEIANMKQNTEDGTEYIVVNPDYIFTFVGWNTKADGSGTMYQPDSSITINEDTTLYAIWNITPALNSGLLKVGKIVDAEAKGGTFTFSIAIPNAAEEGYEYTLYGADNVAVKGEDGKPVTGSLTNGSTFTLLHGQYIIIDSLPLETITVTETDSGDYTPSWSGGTASGASVSVEIKDGRQSEVICTNAKASATSELTVIKTGMTDGESAIVKVTVGGVEYMLVLNATNPQAVITNLAIGSDYTVTELDWAWKHAAGDPVYTNPAKKIVADAAQNKVTIANTRGKDKWFQDESFVINDFSDGVKDEDENQ